MGALLTKDDYSINLATLTKYDIASIMDQSGLDQNYIDIVIDKQINGESLFFFNKFTDYILRIEIDAFAYRYGKQISINDTNKLIGLLRMAIALHKEKTNSINNLKIESERQIASQIILSQPILPSHAYSSALRALSASDKLDWRTLKVDESKNTRSIVFALDLYERLKTIRKRIQPEKVFSKDQYLQNYLSYYFRRLLEEGKVIGLCKLDNLPKINQQLNDYIPGGNNYSNPVPFDLPRIVQGERPKRAIFPCVEDEQSTVFAMLFNTGLKTLNNNPIFGLLVKHDRGPTWDETLTFKPWKCVLVSEMTDLRRCLENSASYHTTLFPSPIPTPDKRFLPLQTANFCFSRSNEPYCANAIRFNPNLGVNIVTSHILTLSRNVKKEHDDNTIDRADRLPDEYANMTTGALCERIKIGVLRSIEVASDNPSKFTATQYFTDSRDARGNLQLLLPVCLDQDGFGKPHIVVTLKVIREGQTLQYEISTLLSLHMAASNARLLERQLPNWLEEALHDYPNPDLAKKNKSLIENSINENSTDKNSIDENSNKKKDENSKQKDEIKGRPCNQFFGLGGCVEFYCKFGSNCRFSHDVSTVRICNRWERSKCVAGASCPFLHAKIVNGIIERNPENNNLIIPENNNLIIPENNNLIIPML